MPDSAAGGPEPRARRHIVIHLGLPKTGSTTIQGLLALNAGRLGEGIAVAAKDALTFPVRHTARYSWQGNWHALGGWRYDRVLRALVRKIDALDFGTLIISDENLIGLRAGHLFDRQDWRANVGLAARLDRALGHYRRSYVVYTREPGRWRTSSYNQAFNGPELRRMDPHPPPSGRPEAPGRRADRHLWRPSARRPAGFGGRRQRPDRATHPRACRRHA